MSTVFTAGEHEQETTFISLVLFELYTTGIYCFCKQKKAIKTLKREGKRLGAPVTHENAYDFSNLQYRFVLIRKFHVMN